MGHTRKSLVILGVTLLGGAIAFFLLKCVQGRREILYSDSTGVNSVFSPAVTVDQGSNAPQEETRIPATEGHRTDWISTIREIQEARRRKDAVTATKLLELLHKIDDPALVEYLYAHLCTGEDPELWTALLALKAVDSLDASGGIQRVNQELVGRLLGLISIPGKEACRDRIGNFLKVLSEGEADPCSALQGHLAAASTRARMEDLKPIFEKLGAEMACPDAVAALNAGFDPANVDPASPEGFLKKLKEIGEEARPLWVRDFFAKTPLGEAAALAKWLEKEDRVYPSTRDPFQIALEEIAKKVGGLDYLETAVWDPSFERGLLPQFMRALSTTDSQRSYDILRTLLIERDRAGDALPSVLHALCNFENRRDSEELCVETLRRYDIQDVPGSVASLLAGSAVMLAEKERQRGLVKETGVHALRWIFTESRNEEIIRSASEILPHWKRLLHEVLPALRSQILFCAGRVKDPGLAETLRDLAK